MTSCGCFECIACVLPGTGGIMIVDREYSGQTPVGMSFSIAGRDDRRRTADAGLHRHRHALPPVARSSSARDGGLARARLDHHSASSSGWARDCAGAARRSAKPDLYDKIADETVCTELEPLIEHLATVEHPALALGEMV